MPVPVDASAAVRITQKDFEEWSKKHVSMKAKPPAEGRDYLRHARNLIPLLESVSELHPFAKAIVFSFKAAIMFEHDRRENDARVSSVFLAQTDMMRVLLDLDNLSKRRQEYFPDDEPQEEDLHKELMDRIAAEIDSCGNSIDTYYKECKLVKFCKSGEWKERMLEYVQTFNTFRLTLQQTLQIRVASGVDDLNAKMNVVLTRLFDTRYDWEKKLLDRTKKLGNSSRWINDPKILQQLVLASNDHEINPKVFDPKTKADSITSASTTAADSDSNFMDWNKNFIEGIREELHTSLEVLCDKNMELFKTKLKLHEARMEEAINRSADHIIRALSGPYDRLENEDLRALWKEMNWIFCVDDEMFSLALLEYYFDKVSSFERNQPEQDSGTPNPQATRTISSQNEVQRLRHVQHPDSWTLEYISAHGSRIAAAIDIDNSGFIRISEANTFTEQIPQGWNLPQWCAYNAIGWFYEIRVYQRRINQVFIKMCELQAEVLPANRTYVSHEVARIIRLFYPLSRHIEGSESQNPPAELNQLIKDKITKQDTKYKQLLKLFKFGIDAESTIHLIFEGKPLESYLLPFVTLLLEHWLELIELCSRETLDIREWKWVEITATNVREFVVDRICFLQAKFKKERGPDSVTNALTTFYGGLYSNFYLSFFLRDEDAEIYSYSDIVAYHRDLDLDDDFPLQPVKVQSNDELLRYESWEDFIVTDDDNEPDVIPPAWGMRVAQQDIAIDNTTWTARGNMPFPFHTAVRCDRCRKSPLEEAHFHCIDCSDFDLCNSCYHLHGGNEILGHLDSHIMVKLTLDIPSPLSYWFFTLADYMRESFLQYFNTRLSGGDGDGIVDIPKCCRCEEQVDLHGTFYQCVGHACQGSCVCANCVNIEAPETRVGHQSWHTLVVMKDLHLFGSGAIDRDALKPESDNESSISDADVPARIVKLETRMKALETRVDTGFAEIKGLLQQLLGKVPAQASQVSNAPSVSRSLPVEATLRPQALGLGRPEARDYYNEHGTVEPEAEEAVEDHDNGGFEQEQDDDGAEQEGGDEQEAGDGDYEPDNEEEEYGQEQEEEQDDYY